jgi:hypothetical protein
MKREILLMVIYTENKPRADYADGGDKNSVKNDQNQVNKFIIKKQASITPES